MAADDVDHLYALPREEFVAARNALAARLKREGRADEAGAVTKLAKPTVAAAALNRLAREQPRLVEALRRAGDDLRRAQTRALGRSGAAEELRRASAAQHEALRALLDAAGSLPASARDGVRESLVAASLDPEAGAELATGRLQGELEAPAFPAGLSAAAPQRDQLAERRRARAAEREREAARRRRVRELERELEAARREAEQSRFALRRLDERVEALEAELAELGPQSDGGSRP